MFIHVTYIVPIDIYVYTGIMPVMSYSLSHYCYRLTIDVTFHITVLVPKKFTRNCCLWQNMKAVAFYIRHTIVSECDLDTSSIYSEIFYIKDILKALCMHSKANLMISDV